MKSVFLIVLSVLFFGASVQAEQLELNLEVKPCMTKNAANKLLDKGIKLDEGIINLGDYFYEYILSDDGVEYENYEEWLDTFIANAQKSLSWNKKEGYYSTDVVLRTYCAEAAECWAWYVVRCDGDVSMDWGGED